MSTDSGTWLNAAAVVVAICALWLTIRSNRDTTKHNKLSVIPRLTTSTSFAKQGDGTYRSLKVRVVLKNVGLGPAVVNSADILLDGLKAKANSFEDVSGLLNKVSPGIQLGGDGSFVKLNKGYAIEVGREVEIAAFQVMEPAQNLEEELKRFQFLVEYESFYGDPFTYDTRTDAKT